MRLRADTVFFKVRGFRDSADGDGRSHALLVEQIPWLISLRWMAVALVVAFSPVAARVARAGARSVRGTGYVEAARVAGAGSAAVLRSHVLPNAAGPWLIVVSTQVGAAVLAEASLGFLGLGGAGASASLGAMLGGEAQTYMHGAPWLVVWPGAVLALLVLSANLLGDALAGALDPATGGSVRK